MVYFVKCLLCTIHGLPRWLSHKEFACNGGHIGDADSIFGLERSPGGGHGNLPQYSCLEDPMDRGAWWATVYRDVNSWLQLKGLSICTIHSSKHLQVLNNLILTQKFVR